MRGRVVVMVAIGFIGILLGVVLTSPASRAAQLSQEVCNCGRSCRLIPDPPFGMKEECTCNVCATPVPGATAQPQPTAPPPDFGTPPACEDCPATPAPPGTVQPLPTGTPEATPQATATPPPELTCDGPFCYADACTRDECPPGQWRLARFYYKFGPYDFCGVSYLGACNEEPCKIPDTPEPEEDKAGQCVIGSSGLIQDGVTCTGEYTVSVSLQLPAWHASRDPYPRSMVRVPTTFRFEHAPSAEAWSAPINVGDASACDAEHDGVIRGWQIGLRTEPAFASPHWEAEDCGSFDGPVGTCTWKRSSWGKPELGVGLEGEPLPAYAVTAWVPYNWYSRARWESCEKSPTWGECTCSGVDPKNSPGWQSCGTPPPGICTGVYNDPPTEWWGKWRTEEYKWVSHDTGWQFIDLTRFGLSTSWMPNPRVQQLPTALEPNPPVGALYVPVIEVQSIIEK